MLSDSETSAMRDEANIPSPEADKKGVKTKNKRNMSRIDDSSQTGPKPQKTTSSKMDTKRTDVSTPSEEYEFNDDWNLQQAHAAFIQLLEIWNKKHAMHERLQEQLEESKAYTNELMDRNLENRKELVILHGVRSREIEKKDNYMNEQRRLRVEHGNNILSAIMLAAENNELKDEIRQLELESGDISHTSQASRVSRAHNTPRLNEEGKHGRLGSPRVSGRDDKDTLKLSQINEMRNERLSSSMVCRSDEHKSKLPRAKEEKNGHPSSCGAHEPDDKEVLKLPPINESKNKAISLSKLNVYDKLGKKVSSIKKKIKSDTSIEQKEQDKNKAGWFPRKMKKNKVTPFTED